MNPEHVARLAWRLAQQRRRPDEFMGRLEARLWAMLEASPEAREVYGRPPHLSLAEHAQTLTADQLDAAAERLASLASRVGYVDLADGQP